MYMYLYVYMFIVVSIFNRISMSNITVFERIFVV